MLSDQRAGRRSPTVPLTGQCAVHSLSVRLRCSPSHLLDSACNQITPGLHESTILLYVPGCEEDWEALVCYRFSFSVFVL